MKSLLFVDDEPKLLDALRRMLRGLRREWRLDFALGGPQALELMAAQPFDVVVTDMRMPGMDGSQLLEEITVRFPDSVRIVLSGQCDRDTILKAVRSAHQFLMKPCDSVMLQKTVERACQLQDRVEDERLRVKVSQVSSLPSVPSLCGEWHSELESKNPDIERIAKMISSDAGAGAKVLQLVSSGFFGKPQKAIGPRQAVTMLGLENIQALAKSPRVFRPAPTEEIAAAAAKISEHSLEVAELARAIAESETDDPAVINQAHVAGLLHDVGNLILIDCQGDGGEQATTSDRPEDRESWEWETQHQTTKHLTIGGYLLGIWGLPDAVVDAAAFHHHPRFSSDAGFTALTAVHVADVLTCEDESAGESVNGRRLDLEYLERIGCSNRLDGWRRLCSPLQLEKCS